MDVSRETPDVIFCVVQREIVFYPIGQDSRDSTDGVVQLLEIVFCPTRPRCKILNQHTCSLYVNLVIIVINITNIIVMMNIIIIIIVIIATIPTYNDKNNAIPSNERGGLPGEVRGGRLEGDLLYF